MTRERAKELLPVIQAYAEGKAIQARLVPERWQDYSGDDPDFQNPEWLWRIKPEPRVVWVNEYRNAIGQIVLGDATWETFEKANGFVGSSHIRTVKFVEVIEP